MKLLGVVERDNTTHPSTPDPQGWDYSASFEFYPFHEGKDMAVYKGILNGRGPRRGDFCVVKAGLDCNPTDSKYWTWVHDVAATCQALASAFNNLVQMRTINFAWPMLTTVDTLSDFNTVMRLFRPHHKRLIKGEVVILESFLEGKFQTFSSAVGWDRCCQSNVTQAFSHYTWYSTRGDLLVTRLQGVSEGRIFHLTTPTVHSRGRGYGPNDGGLAAVVEFFSHHRCNNICCSWPGLDAPGMKVAHFNGHADMHRTNTPEWCDEGALKINQPPHSPHHPDQQHHSPHPSTQYHNPSSHPHYHHQQQQQHCLSSPLRRARNRSRSPRRAHHPVSPAPEGYSPRPLHIGNGCIPRVPSAPVFETTRL